MCVCESVLEEGAGGVKLPNNMHTPPPPHPDSSSAMKA